MITKPTTMQLPDFYMRYIDRVSDGDLIAQLELIHRRTNNLLRSKPEAELDFQYAPDKWTIKVIIAHLIDGERVFAYRALRFSRNDPTELASFDGNLFAPESNAGQRSGRDLLDEFDLVRASTVAMYRGFSETMLDRRGSANKTVVSVRELGFIMAGHEVHHQNILLERYLKT